MSRYGHTVTMSAATGDECWTCDECGSRCDSGYLAGNHMMKFHPEVHEALRERQSQDAIAADIRKAVELAREEGIEEGQRMSAEAAAMEAMRDLRAIVKTEVDRYGHPEVERFGKRLDARLGQLKMAVMRTLNEERDARTKAIAEAWDK